MNVKITEELKEQIISFYKSNIVSIEYLSDKFGLSAPTIIKVLKGVPRWTKSLLFNPNLKEDFFNRIDSEEKAYFLGLIIADGNVFIPKDGRQASISITLDLKDAYLLEKFKQCVCSNTTIGKDGRGCGTIAVRSNRMAEDLAAFGVIPNKSLKSILPKLEDALMPHLIRGIIDGDGSIVARQTSIRNRFLHNISVCGGNILISEIAEYLQNTLKIGKTIVYNYKNRTLSQYKVSNIKDMACLGNWLYTGCSVFMKRKKDMFDAFLNHYHDNTVLTN